MPNSHRLRSLSDVVGAVVGAVEALSVEKAKQLNLILAATLEEINLQSYLQENFSKKAARDWLIKQQELGISMASSID
jgi:hypothetical protein